MTRKKTWRALSPSERAVSSSAGSSPRSATATSRKTIGKYEKAMIPAAPQNPCSGMPEPRPRVARHERRDRQRGDEQHRPEPPGGQPRPLDEPGSKQYVVVFTCRYSFDYVCQLTLRGASRSET